MLFIHTVGILEESNEYDNLEPIQKMKQYYDSCMDEGTNFILRPLHNSTITLVLLYLSIIFIYLYNCICLHFILFI